MNWLIDLVLKDSIAHVILLLGVVIIVGMALGRIRFLGVSFGIAGVLFAGIATAHLGLPMNDAVIDFVRDFGLILFVYTVGLQVGPGFFASLRRQGLHLNLLAVGVVLLGVLLTVGATLGLHVPPAVAVGILAGAVTNTPSLGAAQQALNDAVGPEAARLPGVGYAVAYPIGVIGLILALVLLRYLFRINLRRESESFSQEQTRLFPAPQALNLEVRNPELKGKPLTVVNEVLHSNIVISRLWRAGVVQTPGNDTCLEPGDVLLAVGLAGDLERLRILIGGESERDLRQAPGPLTVQSVIVTRKKVTGKSLAELQLRSRYGVSITRIRRAGIEFVPSYGVTLQFGDHLTVVGEEAVIRKLAEEVGDSPRRLEIPDVLPIFLGIAVGVLLGSLPIRLPGVPAPLKLGMAGGPLIVSILLSRLGSVGRISTYVSASANLMLREVGIVLFLACVGLRAGTSFLPTLASGQGLQWLGIGAVITLVPVLCVALFSRLVLKKNYLVLLGLLAGAMTDPPALAFANDYAGSDAPAVTYATVYPLVTFLRILSAQLLVLFLVR
jgi:putative transport protein